MFPYAVLDTSEQDFLRTLDCLYWKSLVVRYFLFLASSRLRMYMESFPAMSVLLSTWFVGILLISSQVKGEFLSARRILLSNKGSNVYG